MTWSTEGQRVREIVEDLARKGIRATPQQVENALRAAPTTVTQARDAVIAASRTVGHAVAAILAREAEAEEAKKQAAFERDLQERGEVALLNDHGEVVGFAGAPYFQQSPAEKTAQGPDHSERSLQARQQVLQGILDDPATPVLARYRAEQELADVAAKLRMIAALKPRDSLGM
jgi:hypothetical protein